MNMNRQHYILAALLTMIVSSCSKGEIDFSYTQADPRCGQTISFSNTSTKGDSDSKWEWVFGDGATSTLKSPSKIYRKAGTYMVTLTLDKKKFQRVAKEVVVFDSVPSFTCSADTIGTFQDVTFKALTYNPNNLKLEYEWVMPASAEIISGDLTTETLQVYFTEPIDSVEISLITTLGGEETTKTQKFHISRTPAHSLIMATDGGQLLRHRIYTRAIAEPDTITPEGIDLTAVKQMLVDENTLYIFNAAAGEKGAIYAYDMESGKVETVIRNAASVSECAFVCGTLNGDNMYFADEGNKHVFRIPIDTRNQTFTDGNAQLFAAGTSLTGFESGDCTGVGVFADLIYIGATNGIYRFVESDINSGVAPKTGVLGSSTVSAIRIDSVAGKIYSVEEGRLMIRNIDGTFPVELVKEDVVPSTLNICNTGNSVVFCSNDSVWSIPLVQSRNNTTTAEKKHLVEASATALAIDYIKR